MKFESAMKHLRAGKAVTRRDWSWRRTLEPVGSCATILERVQLVTPGPLKRAEFTEAVLTTDDLLAEDWMVR
jgi:hypothetical protein